MISLDAISLPHINSLQFKHTTSISKIRQLWYTETINFIYDQYWKPSFSNITAGFLYMHFAHLDIKKCIRVWWTTLSSWWYWFCVGPCQMQILTIWVAMLLGTIKSYGRNTADGNVCANLQISRLPFPMTSTYQRKCITVLVLGLRPANERRRYEVTPSLIGWGQT